MKKIILGAAVAFAAIFGANTASQTSEMAMSELQIENLEMLAEAESSYPCPGAMLGWKVPNQEQLAKHDYSMGYTCMCATVIYVSVDARCESRSKISVGGKIQR